MQKSNARVGSNRSKGAARGSVVKVPHVTQRKPVGGWWHMPEASNRDEKSRKATPHSVVVYLHPCKPAAKWRQGEKQKDKVREAGAPKSPPEAVQGPEEQPNQCGRRGRNVQNSPAPSRRHSAIKSAKRRNNPPKQSQATRQPEGQNSRCHAGMTL